MKIFARNTGASLALACAICLLVGAAGSSAGRFNLFDPLFGDPDDANSDAHTVSAGTRATTTTTTTTTTTASNGNGRRVLEISNARAASSQRLPPTIADEDVLAGNSLSPTPSSAAAPSRLIESALGRSSAAPAKRHLSSGSSGSALNELGPSGASTTAAAAFRPTRRQTERPEHWSALTNYYETLRKASQQAAENAANFNGGALPAQPADANFYQVEQKLADDVWLSSATRLQRPLAPPPPPIYQGGGAPKTLALDADAQPIFLRQDASRAAGQQQQQLGGGTKTSAWSFPVEQPAGSFYEPHKYGADAWSRAQSSGGGGAFVQPIVAIKGPPQAAGKTVQLQEAPAPQRPIDVSFEPAGPFRQYAPAPPPHYVEQQQQRQLADQVAQLIGGNSSQRAAQAAEQRQWQRLAELLYTRQQEARIKHQLDTLGPALDQRRFQEQVLAENYCGPRNRLASPDLARLNLLAGGGALEPADFGTKSARLRAMLAASAAAASNAPAEFPSHMGLYNGTTPSEDNFLCGATWVHERFALTLASCIPRKLAGAKDSQPLTVRAGEWGAVGAAAASGKEPARSGGGAGEQAQRPPSSFTRLVKSVHPFPKWQAAAAAASNSSAGGAFASGEHNLALLEWAEPTGYLSNYSIVSPACPLQARPMLPAAGGCWAPVRNVTLSEYFDADGEGETKLRRQVAMVDAPIRLLPDEPSCKQETQLELFNFQHPNYICAADARRAAWRLRLNQTDSLGSGIYCEDAGRLALVSIVHPIQLNGPSQFGYMDLTYYRPWMQGVISASSAAALMAF